jgi:hypothetical protein
MKLKQELLIKGLVSSALVLASGSAGAATFSVSGNHRFGTNLFNNLDLHSGTDPGAGNTTAFLENRILLRPDVVVDDRFTVRSEFSLLDVGPASSNRVPENFGAPLGSDATQANGASLVKLRRAYLEWASDWGVFTVGRMPKNWGLGLLYNAGNNVFDDFGTTTDRVGFKAMLGNLILQLGYEKGAEGLINNEGDDIDIYELAIEYTNPESLFDVGLLYTRNVRTAGAVSLMPSSHDLSIYSLKRWGDLQLGGEFVNINAKGPGNAQSVIGLLAQADYMPSNWNFGLDLGLATADGALSYNFHPNYRPFLILFNQSLGSRGTSAKLSSVRGGPTGAPVGGAVANGDGNGGFVLKGNVGYTFEGKVFTLGTDFGYASLARQGSNPGSVLGFETDVHLTQKWYENFSTSYAVGFLFPGSAYGPKAQVGWGLQIRGGLKF